MTQRLESFDDFTLSVLRDGWDTFRRDAMVFVLAGALHALVVIVSLGLLVGPVTVGYLDLVRRSRRGEPVSVGMIFGRFDSFVASTVAIVLVTIAVCLGLFLLVVPGLVALVFATYALPVIAHEGAGGVEGIRRSIALVRANFVHTLAILIVLGCIQALGSMVVIALLVTTPLGFILLEIAYERVLGEPTSPDLVMEP